MLFNASFLATLLIIATPLLSAASPISNARNGGYDLRARDFNCDVKNVSCCKQTVTKEAAQKEFGNLLSLGDVVGNVGLSCTPIGINALSSCKSTPVCCSKVSQSGLVNAGCSPLSVI